MRKAIPFLLTIGVVASLAACSPADTTTTESATGDCVPTASGSASDAVEVSGDFGVKPEVTIDFPTDVSETERTVAIAGDGDLMAVEASTANVQFSLYSGATGEELSSTTYDETGLTPFPVDAEQFLVGIVKTIECSTAGTRVVGVIPPEESFADDESRESLGVGADDDIVFVVDVVSVDEPAEPALPRADGEDQPAVEGFPTVELDDDGRPTITIPDTDPPTELEVAVLKQGDGETVEENSDVVVHYVGMNWTTGEVFDESWARGEPSTFNTGQVVSGFKTALEGQQVGSQIIAVLPPSEGYGEEGSESAGISGTDTIVFVVDIVGIG
ncbi:FKBP-type peptidyl-prolyl cis-trans isomerase [Salinibacterium sp. NK8237]|uniref:FKBP-type peptidyl-prolyl cis-trans isomerase n=1 Tax=Salinibacterium sp. NK8237 TaxID=2792038 RepID=UPI0018CC8B02|nr:FKBP-type peptidyl-prolyl cis-trans isomerase [Salinibacterium sp. NK8237]MBH0131483.1 FKBP-type peptidyl-prolyl cis-trans isomerase [Salinibacterium sp. NK8237]